MTGFQVAPGNTYWAHPQGGTITVFPDGSMDARDAYGKRKRTSATPTNLAAGHGSWKQVWLDTHGEVLSSEQMSQRLEG